MISLQRCICKGQELHPKQCFQTGFAPSRPGEPPRACIIGAAHAGYAVLVDGRRLQPDFFQSKGRTISSVSAVHNNHHPLNLELRLYQGEEPSLYHWMKWANDERRWSRKQITRYIRQHHGPIHITE